MDFDELKRAWDDCDRQLGTGIHLNARTLQSLLRRNAEETANGLLRSDVDYAAPVVQVHTQVDTRWPLKLVRGVAHWITEACHADEIVGRLQATVMRLLRRQRTLRG